MKQKRKRKRQSGVDSRIRIRDALMGKRWDYVAFSRAFRASKTITKEICRLWLCISLCKKGDKRFILQLARTERLPEQVQEVAGSY